MADDPFSVLGRGVPTRGPRPSERLFEFLRGGDRFRCELLDHGEHGGEAQFYQNEELLFARRFETRGLAVQWAEEERKAIEKSQK